MKVAQLLVPIALAGLLAACTSGRVETSRAPISNPTPPPAPIPTAADAKESPRQTDEQPASPAPATPQVSATASPGASGTVPASPFDPAGVELAFEPFASGFDALTFLTHAGDGSGLLYALEQRGRIGVLEADGTPRPDPFLDITDRVRAGGEQGLLGLAFHPEYESNGRLFVNYTDSAGDTVVSEFRADAGTADPASERVLLQFDQPAANHNGGMLAFGPDGYLYIGLGDGGGAGDPRGTGQELADLLGSILRIDVNAQEPYSIPPDNPFATDEQARPEIWASGLRNPWRFSFDRATGALFIGDVGQGSWEEIDVEPAGEGGRNYGWSVMEGPACFREANCEETGLTLPVAAYERTGGNCAVTGGYVYRGAASPALSGAYLYADYCSGLVWALDAAAALAGGEAPAAQLGASNINPTSFGEDETGELYLVGAGGEILRLVGRDR